MSVNVGKMQGEMGVVGPDVLLQWGCTNGQCVPVCADSTACSHRNVVRDQFYTW